MIWNVNHLNLSQDYVNRVQRTTLMTSSNGNIFCVTDFLWGESTRTNGWANSRYAGDLRRRKAHRDVTVMQQNLIIDNVGLWLQTEMQKY